MHCARLARIIGVLLFCSLASLLSACSTVKLAYNNLPELAYWWIDGYVDLDARESPRVRAELNTLLAWHRREELPRLAGLLQQARAQASGDVSPEQACRLAEDIRQRVLATLERIELPAAELAVSLDESQLYALELKYDKINAAYRQDWLDLDPAKQRDKRFKLYLERYEDFYGRLDSAQRQLLRNMVERSSLDPATIDADRRRRQAEAIEILKRASREKPAI